MATTTVYTGSPITITGVSVGYSIGYYFSCGVYSESGTIASNVTSSTYKWTPETSKFLTGFGDSTKGALQITVYPNNTQLSSAIHYNYTLVLDENVKPVIDNVSIARSGTTYNGKSLSERTNIGLTISLQKVAGATQTIYISDSKITYTANVEAGSGTATINQVFSPSKVTGIDYVDVTYTVRAVDSRGRSDTKTVTERFYKYNPPTSTASVARSADGTKVVLTYSESHMNTVAGLANSITEYQATLYVGGSAVNTNLLSGTSPITLTGTVEPAESYSVHIYVKDKVSGYTTVDLISPGDSPVMDFGKDGNTIVFFGSAPTTADKQSVMIGHESGSRVIFDNDNMQYLRDGIEFFKMGYDTITVNDATKTINKLSFGDFNTVTGNLSTALGSSNTVSGECSMTTGSVNQVSGNDAFAAGIKLIASSDSQTVVGKYNVEDSEDKYLFIVGNGLNDSLRSNALGVRSDGDIEINGKSVNRQIAGELGHWYNSGTQKLSADKTTWELSLLTNGYLTTLGNDFITTTDLYTIKITKSALYAFMARVSFRPNSAGGRASFDIYKNYTRVPMYSCTMWAPKTDTRTRIIPYIMQLNAGDTINFYANMIDAEVGSINIADFMVYALDYEGKYK